uniref:Uncharacterized protein n=2 Tax=Caenorhabditis japonica TaxID=281687 RepID=A0A8R1DMJ4_CAEJA
MKGLSLNRNMAAMTQSLVRVEEETATDGHHSGGEMFQNGGRTGRSTSVSPRPSNEQFVRSANGSATFNVKHSSTLARFQKFAQPAQNGNMTATTTTTPLSSRTTRSVLRVHNVNSINSTTPPRAQHAMSMSKSTISSPQNSSTNRSGLGATNSPRRALSGARQPDPSTKPPPTVTINPSTPSRPASVASSAGRPAMSNLEGLQGLIQMQEDALRRAALDGQSAERKLSWHSDQDANRQSTSTHSSLGSLCSSKSIDGAHALNKMGGVTPSVSFCCGKL